MIIIPLKSCWIPLDQLIDHHFSKGRNAACCRPDATQALSVLESETLASLEGAGRGPKENTCGQCEYESINR